ncbi:MAG TPA: glycosyltransferase [Rhodothermales bacterium]|nr:glycosyltransferase [Rhodothermales bacterium]
MIVPHDAGGNPYLGLLVEALRKEGIVVESLKPGSFPFLRLLSGVDRNDVVHLQWQHGYFLGRNLASAVIRSVLLFLQIFPLKVRGVRFVWTVHNLVNHERHLARWELLASRVLARTVDRVVAHCNRAATELASAYGLDRRRILVVPHGHFGDAYPPPIARGDARRQLGLTESATMMLFFGQIREYKSVPSLIEAFLRVKPSTAHLAIVGEPKPPSLAEEITAMASDEPQITLRLEHVDPETLVRYISASDVVVLPYVRSLTSGASILAATMGRPIIAPRLGCMAEMPEGAAIFYDESGVDGIEAALLKSFEAPLDAMGRIAADYVAQHSWSCVAKQLVGIYNEIS